MLREKINIDNLRSGNYETYEKLFVEWHAPLCSYAYSILHDLDDAKDTVQKTFYKLWDKREEIDIHTSIKSYLYRMVHNDCLNRLKQYKIRSDHKQNYSYDQSVSINDVEDTIAKNELEMQIELAIDSLPVRCREVFKLSRYEHMSYAEIADSLNISVNTVETHIVKALRILRESLKDYLYLIVLIVLFFI